MTGPQLLHHHCSLGLCLPPAIANIHGLVSTQPPLPPSTPRTRAPGSPPTGRNGCTWTNFIHQYESIHPRHPSIHPSIPMHAQGRLRKAEPPGVVIRPRNLRWLNFGSLGTDYQNAWVYRNVTQRTFSYTGGQPSYCICTTSFFPPPRPPRRFRGMLLPTTPT